MSPNRAPGRVGKCWTNGWPIASRSAGPTTRHGYSLPAERFKAAIGNVAVSALGPRDVDRLYAHWRAEGMSQAGVVHHHRVLRAALNQAKKWEWVDRNFALNATVTTPAPPELHVPSIEQTETLVLRAEQGASPDLGSIVLSRS